MIAGLVEWLLLQGRRCRDLSDFVDALCPRLATVGVPVLRCNVAFQTMHPEVSIRMVAWRRAEVTPERLPTRSVRDSLFVERALGVVQELELDHTAFDNEAYRQSPFAPVLGEHRTVRCRVGAAHRPYAYPILADLEAMGVSDYICLPLPFVVGPPAAISFAVDHPNGLPDAFVTGAPVLQAALAACLEVHAQRHILRSLLRTYVGADPGERVLAGQFHCGAVQSIDAALWFSDLRGFTELSGRLDSGGLIATLNAYFAAVAPPIARHGGEVLKYIGDAILAVFPVRADRPAAQACSAALRAATEATAALAELNARRAAGQSPPLRHGIGLHFGAAEYGNIGAPGRLDFTVIGADVNLASRIEGLCGRLGRELLLSSTLAELAPEGDYDDLGVFELKGIVGARRVLAPASSVLEPR